MFELVLKEAARAGARKVTRVHLVIGEMTGVAEEAVRFYFDRLGEGTIVERADIDIRLIPPVVLFQSCGTTSELERRTPWRCPGCLQGRQAAVRL